MVRSPFSIFSRFYDGDGYDAPQAGRVKTGVRQCGEFVFYGKVGVFVGPFCEMAIGAFLGDAAGDEGGRPSSYSAWRADRSAGMVASALTNTPLGVTQCELRRRPFVFRLGWERGAMRGRRPRRRRRVAGLGMFARCTALWRQRVRAVRGLGRASRRRRRSARPWLLRIAANGLRQRACASAEVDHFFGLVSAMASAARASISSYAE